MKGSSSSNTSGRVTRVRASDTLIRILPAAWWPPLLLLLVVLTGWQTAVWWFDWPEFLVPAPTDVVTAVVEDGDR